MKLPEYVIARHTHDLFGPFNRYKITSTELRVHPHDQHTTTVWSIWDAEQWDEAIGLWGAQVYSITSENTKDGLQACKDWIEIHKP